VEANEELADEDMDVYYICCGKSICVGCVYSFHKSGNDDKCPFCNADQDKTDEEELEELMKRTAANDATSMCVLGTYYFHGQLGLLQDRNRAMELWKQAAELGSSKAHYNLGNEYHQRGDLKKAKIHFEAGAMAGHEGARNMLGNMEFESGKQERAVKHWIIAASAGDYGAMYNLQQSFEFGFVGRGVIDPTLTAYNTFCAKMRSEARNAHIKMCIEN
jgi:TPR repeat protein